MDFATYKRGSYPAPQSDLFYLVEDNWDDFGYKTTFYAYYFTSLNERIELGAVQVAATDMEDGHSSSYVPEKFNSLPDNLFALGSESYYVNVAKLGKEKRESIHIALNDMAYNLDIFKAYMDERVVRTSLLRGNSEYTVRTQLHRIACGGARLTPYNFRYHSPEPTSSAFFSKITLDFSVEPDSDPPTNIHVLIGRNGTGKTRLLQSMILALQTDEYNYGNYVDLQDQNLPFDVDWETNLFANVLCISFSPFDNFSSVSALNESDSGLAFSYIGLDKKSADLLETLKNQFIESFENCMASLDKRNRWLSTIKILESDPVFSETHVDSFMDAWLSNHKEQVSDTFRRLSSGHKVILLIITACVEKLEEKSVVFMDEPENHLHPPLLSAFIRAMSYLLMDRNGVAVISTHSPVVLQEVPSSCVWHLRRTNTILTAERLQSETFGTSISSLTSEVFDLEVTDSGFHRMIRDRVFNNPDDYYDDIYYQFKGQLGNEAQAILKSLIAIREKGQQ